MWTTMLQAWARARAFLSSGALDRDLDEELQSHVEMLTEDNLRHGLPPADARRQALLAVGPLESTKERHRDARGLPSFDSLVRDVRYAARTLRRDVRFTWFATAIIGLGIGAAVTVFSVVRAVLLEPLPFRDAGRLVWVANNQCPGRSCQTVQVGHFTGLRDDSRTLADLAAYFAFYTTGNTKVTGSGEPERLTGVPVTRNFFQLLGVAPVLGRGFTPEEAAPNGPRAALLTDRLWRRRFGADRDILGRVLTLNDEPVTVVGVLPASFDFASVFAPGTSVDLFTPFPLFEGTHRWGNTLSLIGRLAPDTTVDAAREELAALADRQQRMHPEWNEARLTVIGLSEHVSGRFRTALLVLAGAVGVLLLMVSGNLSNLLLARAASRQQEMTVRAALGAGRGRLVRQLLTENLLLASCGGALGLALAALAVRAVARLDAFSIPLLDRVHLDGATLAFAIVATAATALLFGAAPALQVPVIGLGDRLTNNTRAATGGRGYVRLRQALVVAETALACVLLVAAGLLARSFLHVLDVDLGFAPERAAALRVDPGARYATAAERNAYFDETLRRVRAVPGVESAGLTDVLPLTGNRSWGVAAKGRETERKDWAEVFVRIVSDGYFDAMGIRLREGRGFTPGDDESSAPVIAINETLAKRLWPHEAALGRTVVGAGFVDRRVVAIVQDVRHLALEEASGAEIYMPIRQTGDYGAVELVLRTALPPSTLASSVRAALTPLDPNLSANDFRTLQQLVDRATSSRRFIVFLLSGFSFFALLLASFGLYAVISCAVSERTPELGIRVALGAPPEALQRGILLQTLGLTAIGMIVGLPVAWMVARAAGDLLFGVTPADPMTILGILAVLTTVSAVAGFLPARRAARIDPLVALRST